jgi:hypothetical protein
MTFAGLLLLVVSGHCLTRREHSLWVRLIAKYFRLGQGLDDFFGWILDTTCSRIGDGEVNNLLAGTSQLIVQGRKAVRLPWPVCA